MLVHEFYAPTRILIGNGAAAEVGPAAAALGSRALVVTGSEPRRWRAVCDALSAHGVTATRFSVRNEPTTDLVQAGRAAAESSACDVVVGVGGGSPLDAGKAIAALMTNPGPIDWYLEVVGEGRPIANSPAPFIAVPTTAGPGTEVTRNAVLKVPLARLKVSMRSPLMLPALAIIDPLLTRTMPKTVTAATGLDALTQVIEPFVSRFAAPITDALCRDGIRLAAASLASAYEDGDDMVARSGMCKASLFGGLALANAKLGAVHGFAGPIGGMFEASHGLICGRLLPPVMEMNVAALTRRAPDSPSLRRYDEVARILTGSEKATAADGVRWVAALGTALSLPGLGSAGVTAADLDDIVAKAKHASSMQGNPIQLEDAELRAILEQAL